MNQDLLNMPELQMVRPIDGNALLRKLIQAGLLKMDILKDSAEIIAVQSAIDAMPTLKRENRPLPLDTLKSAGTHPIWVVPLDGPGPGEWKLCTKEKAPGYEWFETFVLVNAHGETELRSPSTYGKEWTAYADEYSGIPAPPPAASCSPLTVVQLKKLLNNTIWVQFIDEPNPPEPMFCAWRPTPDGSWYQFILADSNGKIRYLDADSYRKTWIAFDRENGTLI